MRNRVLIVATKNKGKLLEFSRMLVPYGFIVKSMSDVGFDLDVEETGATFAENAKIKAMSVYNATKSYVIADDSGLEIDALNKEPGVHSARYLGEDSSYSQKMNDILERLSNVSEDKRTARYVVSIAYITPRGDCRVFEQTCEGRIGYKPQGDNGFGYDPIFMIGDKSMAQMSNNEKDLISHRGKVLREFVKTLD